MTRTIIAALGLILMLVGNAASACTAAGGGQPGITAINELRASSGVGGLAHSAALTAVAQAFACDMIARGYFSHRTPEGVTFNSRLRAAGYNGRCGAENIAYAGSSAGAGQPISQWLGSPPHTRNMLGRRYSVAGFAGARGSGKTVWVLILGNC